MDENMVKSFPQSVPPQKQPKQPGVNALMDPVPVYEDPNYPAGNRLAGKVAVVTGGDSGIGRSVAVSFAKEGADVAVVYLEEHDDANEVKNIIENIGKRCLLLAGDLGEEIFCRGVINKVIDSFGRIDILVNNAAEQHPQNSIEDIEQEQLEKTFKTNFYSYFFMTKAALPYMKCGDSIINTASITAYKGDETLIDYSSTKGAVVSFTRSMSMSLAKSGIRINCVAPGPVWTPLIPSSFNESEVKRFGSDTPIGRPAQPLELSGAYVYLASNDSSYVTGQTIHVNGGVIVNG